MGVVSGGRLDSIEILEIMLSRSVQCAECETVVENIELVQYTLFQNGGQ